MKKNWKSFKENFGAKIILVKNKIIQKTVDDFEQRFCFGGTKIPLRDRVRCDVKVERSGGSQFLRLS